MRRRALILIAGLSAVAAGVLAAIALAAPTVVGDVQRVNPAGVNPQSGASIAMAPDGHFAIAYVERPSGGHADVFVRVFAANGTATSAPTAVNAGVEARDSAAIAMDANGRFVVTYTYDAGSGLGIRAQRFDAAATPVGAEIVVSATPGRQVPRIASAADGRFAIAWERSGGHVDARLFAADGTPVTAELNVDQTGSTRFPDVVMTSTGEFVVAYQRSTTVGEAGHVPARRYTALGVPAGNEFNALTGDLNQPYDFPAIAMADDGRVTRPGRVMPISTEF